VITEVHIQGLLCI